MTLEACKRNFVELLADKENRVVALSGKWGTGKSHLWDDVRKEAKNRADEKAEKKSDEVKAVGAVPKDEKDVDDTDEKIGNAIYISLFGLSSIPEVKKRVAQGVLPLIGAGGPVAETIGGVLSGIKTVLKGVHSGFSALDELELVAVPAMIRGRFIVIDDIERKHEKLSIDEILGFIDDCVQTLECRILLILNSDQLKKDKDLWEVFREKVIDQELRLDTTPTEAFDIAVKRAPSRYADHIKPCVEACGITNIRIIRKILRLTNRLLASDHELPVYVLGRVIPSLTLLSAIHYKGIDEGPSFDFVLGYNGMGTFLYEYGATDEQKNSPEGKARARWRLLMAKLGIQATDDFEALVADFLRSGLLDATAVSQIVERYEREERQLTMRTRTEAFFEHCVWFPELTEQQLLDEAERLLVDAGDLDMYTATRLHDKVASLANGVAVADRFIDTWVAAFRAQPPVLDEDFHDLNRGRLHPRISDEIREVFARQQIGITVLECCRRVREKQGWGTRENNRMRTVTPAEYEAEIRNASGEDLRILLLQSMDFLKNRGGYTEHFGEAMNSFLAACQSIVHQEPESRRSDLIRLLFQDSGMATLLEVIPAEKEGGTPEEPVPGEGE